MADRIVIDIGILQGIFGDLTKLQQQIGGLAPAVAGVDRAASQAFGNVQQNVLGTQSAISGLENGFDAGMRNIVADIMAPTARTQELEAKLRSLGEQVRTSKSVGEITKLKKEIAATQKELDGVDPGAMEKKVGGAAARMRSMFSGLVAPVAGAFAVGGITSFVGGMVKAAGAQQQFGVAMNSMLQDKVKADTMMAEVKEFAAKTPFDLEQTQKATTQMLGMGFSAEDVIPSLKKLGDVAAGLGQPMGDLAYLYATTRAQGKMNSTDLMQFANRGIPIIEELSKVLGVSQAEVKGLVEKGGVGFQHLEQVLNNLTGEGSKFGGLMEGMNSTISGQLGQLSEAWETFKTDMGMALAPVITDVIEVLSAGMDRLRAAFAWVQDNGPLVKGVLTGVAIAVGVYSSALLVNNAATMYNSVLQGIAAVRTGALAIATNLSTAAITVATAVQWAWNAALTANPIGLVIAGIAALVGAAVYAWNNFEGFRSFLYGLWESVKTVFGAIKDFVMGVFKSLGDVLMGWANVLKSALTLDWSGVKAGWSQMKSGMDSLLPDPLELARKAMTLGGEAGTAFAKGQEKGRAAFRADKSKKGAATPGINATDVAHGQDMGAASLVGDKSGSKEDKGVTVGGSEGSGRTITMDIKITNNFSIPKDVNMGAREAADRIVGDIIKKLNDSQFALG